MPAIAAPLTNQVAMWPGRVLASLMLSSSAIVLGLVPMTLRLRLIRLTWPVAAPFAAMLVYGALASVLSLVLIVSYKRSAWAVLGRRLVFVMFFVSLSGLALATAGWLQWASSLYR